MRVIALAHPRRHPFDFRLAQLDVRQGAPDWTMFEAETSQAPPDGDLVINYGRLMNPTRLPELSTRPVERPARRWFRRLTDRSTPLAILATEGLPIEQHTRTFVLPEAVSTDYFEVRKRAQDNLRVGWLDRPGLRDLARGIEARVARFRDDVEIVGVTDPTPAILSGLSVWFDPATDPHDADGRTAEALVAGLAVVAARTPINVARLEGGRTGVLVPTGDPNETVHAILNALFKPELGEKRRNAARQTRDRFRPEHRFTHLQQAIRNFLP